MSAAEDFPLEVNNWQGLMSIVEHFSRYNKHDWLFRGVTELSYGLIPKIGREQSRKDPSSGKERVPYRIEDEVAILELFRQHARAYLRSAPQSDIEWLALAQHHGLPTRLLDWTDTLLVAAWFAVLQGGATKEGSAIWVTKGIAGLPHNSPVDPMKRRKPIIYRPPHISARIAAQGSVLMVCPNPTEDVVLPFARQIVIKKGAAFTIKKRLNDCGVNSRSLFPDLGGITQHLEWLYKNDWLTRYTR